MNKRIKLLAEQCFSFKYKTDATKLNEDQTLDQLDNFARLILNECIDACDKVELHMLQTGFREESYGVVAVRSYIKARYNLK